MDLVSSPFLSGDKVVVLEGRHFQDFAAGDSGIVIRADAESQTCQVHFKHRPGESFNVAWRHLNKCVAQVVDAGHRPGWPAEDDVKVEPAAVLPMAVADMGDALGTVSSAYFWESKLANLDADHAGNHWSLQTADDFQIETGGQDDLALAVEGCAKATASSSLLALREAKGASSRIRELEEKMSKHSREHWLGMDCLQEKVNSLAVSQKEVNAEFKGSLHKELSSVNMQVQSLYEQCEAIKDMVANLQLEMKRKASHEQLEDLEHQQCKAMETLLRRWDHCAENRRQRVESEVGQALDEVQRADSKSHPSEAVMLQVEDLSAANRELASKLGRLQANFEQMSRSLPHVSHLSQEQRMKQVQNQGLEEPAAQWHQRYQGLSTKVDSLQRQVETLRSGFQSAQERADKEQAILDGLRLRADAAAEGLASEVRLREEGVLRVETRLENVAREMDLAMGTLRGSLEKQLHAMLATAQSAAERKQRDWQLECQKRQDVESALREQQCEMAEMRSKLLRKEQALLEAAGFTERSGGPCGPSPYGPNASSGPLEPVVAQPRGADVHSPLSRRLAAPVACGPVSSPLSKNFA